MYGLIARISARSEERDALVRILAAGTEAMPGCRSHIVATDLRDAEVIWVTEVWESKAAHSASLDLPSVQAAVARARPLIVGLSMIAETAPGSGSNTLA